VRWQFWTFVYSAIVWVGYYSADTEFVSMRVMRVCDDALIVRFSDPMPLDDGTGHMLEL
jgi:hypothetical protein